MIKIAIMGYGIIGSGVAEVLEQNRDVIAKQVGQEVELKYALDLREFSDSSVADRIVHDFKVIEQNKEINIVVETMGGLNPAYSFVKACLLADKHVVISNKALMAVYGTELLAVAREKGVNPLFEASVGGGIPIIRPLHRCLMGERIEEITGTSNGTINFILAKMDKEDESFENVLKEAQNLEYAERNPEVDMEGHDTCREIVILTATATGREASFEDTYTEGITRIMDTDFKYAEKMRISVKLFDFSHTVGGEVDAFIAPVMIQKSNPLYSADDVFNGIMVKGNTLGTSMFYGNGAGELPTASAAVADIIEVVQNLERSLAVGWSSEKQAIESMDLARFRYFARVAGSYRNKEKDIKRILGRMEVVELYGMDEFAVLTAEMSEGEFKAAAAAYGSAGQARSDYGIKQMIRATI